MSIIKRALSITEFCHIYGIGRTRVYVEIKAGRLRAVKVGNRTLILIEDAERWASSLGESRHAVGGKS
jgi:excisionase family DNA binding protein